MILATLAWIPRAAAVLLAKGLAILLSPVIALFFYRQEEHRVTGYPSQLPGKLREHIDFPFTWASTFDDCADAHWYSGRTTQTWPFKGKTQADYDASAWLRYCVRVLWLCRNPAYVLARDLGFDQTGLEVETVRDEDALWDTGHANSSLWKLTNAKGRVGFLYKRQVKVFGQWFIELVCGYKAPWANERKNRAMVAVRTTLKRYPKQAI